MDIRHTNRGTPVLDVTGYQIMQEGDYHRFVCHKSQVVTAGFRSEEALCQNADSFLATEQAIERCRARYTSLFTNAA